jgi:hypothetical protein
MKMGAGPLMPAPTMALASAHRLYIITATVYIYR